MACSVSSDSIAKYALLYCEANDSSIAITDRELSVQVASLYNYNRLQEESLRQKSKAQAMKYWLLISITVLTYSIVFFVWNRRQQQRRIQKQLTELRALGNELSRSIEAREHLRAMYEASFSLYNDRLNSFQEEVLAHKGQLRLAQKEYDKLRQSHENTEQVLSKQICELELRIDVLKKQAGLSEDALISMNLQSENSVRLLKRIIRSSRSKLTEGLWNRLFQTVGLYYPKLIQDILQSDGISPLGIRIIILLGPLHLSNKEIIGLLEISNQTLTNTKEDINQVLFGEHSARPLYKNLVSQYRLYKQ